MPIARILRNNYSNKDIQCSYLLFPDHLPTLFIIILNNSKNKIQYKLLREWQKKKVDNICKNTKSKQKMHLLTICANNKIDSGTEFLFKFVIRFHTYLYRNVAIKKINKHSFADFNQDLWENVTQNIIPIKPQSSLRKNCAQRPCHKRKQ